MICNSCRRGGDLSALSYIEQLQATHLKVDWLAEAKACHDECVTVDCYCQHRMSL